MSRTEVAVHPLVLVNISDHFSRAKLQGSGNPSVQAIGAFVGIQDGANVNILDTMEVVVTPQGVDLALLNRKLALTVNVFPRYEFLGWYLAGQVLSDAEMLAIQKQMQEINERPLVLILDTKSIPTTPSAARGNKKVLPITVYETVMQRINDQPVQSFVEVPIKLETTESERITVDYTSTQKSSMGKAASTLDPHMESLKNAVQMLKSRVTILLKFVSLTKEGKIAPDYELLREVEAICNQLPAFDPALLRKDFQAELSDALLVSLLASVTKETAAMSAILEKFFQTYPSPGQADEKSVSAKRAGTGGKASSGGGGIVF